MSWYYQLLLGAFSPKHIDEKNCSFFDGLEFDFST
jgi:hypothetical protein